MAGKTLKTVKPAPEATTPDPMAFIEARSTPKPAEPAEAPAPKAKSEWFFVYMDLELLARIDKECKRRGGIGRSTLLRQLAAEHLPE